MKRALVTALCLACLSGTASAEDLFLAHVEKPVYMVKNQTPDEWAESVTAAAPWAEKYKMTVVELATKYLFYQDSRDYSLDTSSITKTGDGALLFCIVEEWDADDFAAFYETYMDNKHVKSPGFRAPDWLKPITVYTVGFDPATDTWAIINRDKYEYGYENRYTLDAPGSIAY